MKILYGINGEGQRSYIYWLGDVGYNFVIWFDKFFGFNGRISKSSKKMVKKATNYLNDFYETARRYTKSKKCHSVVCGHTHMQEIRKLNDVMYYNCGDFRESCGYIIEENDGCLKLCDCSDLEG